MQEIENKQEEDEISLIDLFSVIIKFRKLIIIGTILATVIIGCFVFITSKKDKTQFNKTQFTCIVNQLPSIIDKSINSSIQRHLDTNIIKSSLWFQVNNTKQIFDIPFTYETEEDNFINYFNENVYNKKIVIKKNETDYTITISSNEIDYVSQYFDDYLIQLNTSITNSYKNDLTKIINNIQTVLDNNNELIEKHLIIDLKSYNDYLYKKSILNSVIENEFEYFSIIDDISISKETNSIKTYLTKLCIILFISLFMFIIIAFICNAIQNIKKDSVAMNKINKAWKEGK